MSEKTLMGRTSTLLMGVCLTILAPGMYADEETLPALIDGLPPANLDDLWEGFDPRSEPLETEILREWEEEGVTMRVVRFRIGVLKGKKAMLAGIYGFPSGSVGVPGLLQIHGGGQYADYRACKANALRGYATLSIAWAGRLNAPEYLVNPAGVELFWSGKTDDPQYRLTTDWGAVDGYHAPGRNVGNHFPSVQTAEWTLDHVDSPRNSGWFLCAMAARRGLTFLERQPEVDRNRLGVYGHSMGGKLTVMTSIDPRVKAAAPSCGGISDRDNRSELFRSTLGDQISLQRIRCPIFFLSPANDFHGRIGDLPRTTQEIGNADWRLTCSPHMNHQDTPQAEVATLLWMDQHLKGTFEVPESPETTLLWDSSDGVPRVIVQADRSKPIASIDVFYTQQGKAEETPRDMQDTIHRFWHHATVNSNGDRWEAKIPVSTVDQPLWVYANVTYSLGNPVKGVGYYYGDYETDKLQLSSLLKQFSPGDLPANAVQATLSPTDVIEDFQDGWQKEWYRYRRDRWSVMTNKLNSQLWTAPSGAALVFTVQSDQPNRLVILLDDYAAEVELTGGKQPQEITMQPGDFESHAGTPRKDWKNIRMLKLSPAELLRPSRGQSGQPKLLGANWKGAEPQFMDLRWKRPD